MHHITNIFGTDGIRTTLGTDPLTLESLPVIGTAIAKWAQQKYGSTPKILLAHDTRISCALVKAALKSGLLQYPLEIHDAGVLPTPAVFYVAQQAAYDCGIIISASHNPYQDNGIKIIDARTGKITEHDERIISQFVQQHQSSYSYENVGSDTPCASAQQRYMRGILKLFPHHFLQGTKIVLDCAHGATSSIAPQLFKKCGAQVIAVHHTPNGKNINENSGALYPELLQQKVLAVGADIGFAFDGDGDRVIVVTKNGIIKNGDDILAILIQHPLYQHTTHIVGTVMTNQGFDSFLQQQSKKLVRVAVGDKYIAEYLEKENLLLGGEQSGHIIMRDYLNTGDGIFVALRVLEVLIMHNAWDMNSFQKYPQILVNVPVAHKKDLKKHPFAEIIGLSQALLSTGRLIVRYSGTENVLRIMAEDVDLMHAERVVNELSVKLQKALSLNV